MIEIRWDVFKPSGTWGYGGVVRISGRFNIWQREFLLAEIDGLQNEMQKGAITGGRWAVVIRETDAQMADPSYHGLFYTQLYLPTIPWE